SDLGKPLRINHHSASYRNQIGSHFDRALGIQARFDPTACHKRTAARYHAGKFRDRTLCRGISLLDRTTINTGLSHWPAVPVIVERNGDVVEIQRGKLVTKQFGVLERITVRLGLEWRDAKPCDQLWTECVANGLRDSERKVHALRKRASPMIHTMIGSRLKKLMNRVVFGSVNLNAVETGFSSKRSRRSKACNQAFNLIGRHRPWRF